MTPAKKWAESSRMSQDSVTLDNILNNEEKTHNSNTHVRRFTMNIVCWFDGNEVFYSKKFWIYLENRVRNL